MKQGFNFLKPQVEPPSVWTKVYDWVIGTARVILIIAIIAVLGAMVVRIILDVQGNQLDEQVRNLESLMAVRTQEETKYRNLQSRINSYDSVWTNSNLNAPIIDKVIAILPKSATELTITLNEKSLIISGKASNSDIDVMEKALKIDPAFTQAKLSRLETATEDNVSYVKFSFQADVTAFEKKVFTTPVMITTTPTASMIPTN